MFSLFDAPLLLFVVTALGLYLIVEAGFRFGRARRLHADETLHEQLKDARDGLTLVLSLLLGFTLAMALPRHDIPKQLVVDEAGHIGTATLRAQLLPEPYRGQAITLLTRYVGVRVAFFEAAGREPATGHAVTLAERLQNELWQVTAGAAKAAPTPITASFIQALNDTIDMSEKQLAALENRLPRSIWVMILFLAAMAAFASGLALQKRLLLNLILLPLMVSLIVSLIADLDTPGRGLIRIGLESMHRLQTHLSDAPK